MVESALYFVAGMAVAGLIALMLVPLLNARAERLYRRRIEASLPRSQSEFVAAKDAVRAEMAAHAARTEFECQRLRDELVGARLAEADAETIRRTAAAERATIAEAVGELERRLEETRENNRKLTEKLAQAEVEHRDLERQLANREREASAHSTEVESQASEMRQALTDAEERIASLTAQMQEFLNEGGDADRTLPTGGEPAPAGNDASKSVPVEAAPPSLRDAVLRLRGFNEQRRTGSAGTSPGGPDKAEPAPSVSES